MRWDGRNLHAAGITFALVLLCVGPLLHLLIKGGLASLVTTDLFDPTFFRSIGLAAAAASLCGILGGITACLLFFSSKAVQRLLWVLFLYPLLLPSYLHALAWADLLDGTYLLNRAGLDANSYRGTALSIFVLSISYYPIFTVVGYATLRFWDPLYHRVAWANGQNMRSVLRLFVGYASSPVLMAWLACFLLAFSDFAIPDFFMVSTFSTEIFIQISSYLDFESAVAKTFPVLVLCLCLMFGLVRIAQKATYTFSQAIPEDNSVCSDAVRSIVSLVAIIFSGVLVGLPLLRLVVSTKNWSTLVFAFNVVSPDLIGGLVVSSCVSVVCTVIGVLASYSIYKKHAPAGGWLLLSIVLLLAVPHSLLALAQIDIFNRSGMLGVFYDAGGALYLTLFISGVPVSVLLMLQAWKRVGDWQEQSAITNGVHWFMALIQIQVPQMWPYLLASALLSFVFCFNELTYFTLLAPPGLSSIPLRIFQTVHYGPASLLAAVCLWQILFLIAFSLLIWALSHAIRKLGDMIYVGD